MSAVSLKSEIFVIITRTIFFLRVGQDNFGNKIQKPILESRAEIRAEIRGKIVTFLEEMRTVKFASEIFLIFRIIDLKFVKTSGEHFIELKNKFKFASRW